MVFGRRVGTVAAATAAAAMCLIACSSCGSSTAGTVTLEFYQYKVEAVDKFKELIADFEDTHPTINVDIIHPADAATDLRTRFVKGKVPDVLTVDGGRHVPGFHGR